MRKTKILSTSAMGALILLALPAVAQQDPHHPGGAATAPAVPPGAPGPVPGAGPMGGPGMMMGGQGMMGMSDEGERRRMMRMHHHGAGGSPMNVIINVGPDIQVRVEDGEERGRRPGGMGTHGRAGMTGPGMMGGAMGPGAMRHFERIDAHLAYVRAALRITDAQTPQWNAFADAARAAAARLQQAYTQAMQAAGQPAPAPAQLELRIALLLAQLEATRAIAAPAGALYAALSDEQKRAADELLAEHLRDMRMRGL
jgi:hypothetical protein